MTMNKYIAGLGMGLVLMLTVAACKGGGAPAESEKSYIVEGESAELPGTPSNCVAKGAVGAMGLLLKGDCAEVKPPECGNYALEDGEQCDPPDGKVCDIKCQKIVEGVTGGGGGGTTTGAVTIATTSIKDGVIGQPYESESIVASGKKASDQYVWSTVAISPGFELKPSGAQAVKVVSQGATAYGSYSATVKSCLQSDSTKCAEKTFAFKIVDQLTLTAYYASDFMSIQKSGPFCVSSSGSSCGNLMFDANTLPVPKDTDKNQAILGLVVEGLVKGDSYIWSASYQDGGVSKNIPDPTANTAANDGIFLYRPDPKTTPKGSPFRFLMITKKAYGKTYKDVVVTVKNNFGGEQKLTFPEIKIDSKSNIAADLLPQPPSPDGGDECNNLVVTSVNVSVTDNSGFNETYDSFKESKTLDGKKFFSVDVAGLQVDETYSAEIIAGGGVSPYKIELYGFGSDYNKSAYLNGEVSIDLSQNKLEVVWPPFAAATPNMKDYTDILINDSSGSCPQTIMLRIARVFSAYPPLSEEPLSNIKSVYANIYFNDVDSNTFFKIKLLDQDGNELASTEKIKNDQWEGKDSNTVQPIKVKEGVNAKVGDVKKVMLYLNDSDWAWTDMVVGVKEIKLQSKYRVWSLYDGTCAKGKDCKKTAAGDFIKCKSGGCSNDEVDGNFESWIFDISQSSWGPISSVDIE